MIEKRKRSHFIDFFLLFLGLVSSIIVLIVGEIMQNQSHKQLMETCDRMNDAYDDYEKALFRLFDVRKKHLLVSLDELERKQDNLLEKNEKQLNNVEKKFDLLEKKVGNFSFKIVEDAF